MVRRHAVHDRRRAVHVPRRQDDTGRQRAGLSHSSKRPADDGERAGCSHRPHREYPAPFGPGLRLLDNLPILPRHKLEAALERGNLRPGLERRDPAGEIWLGMGPFQLARYEPGQRLVFARNPHYWRKAPDDGTALPYLDEVVLEIVPDQNAELRAAAGRAVRHDPAGTAPGGPRGAATAGGGRASVSMVELGVSTDPDVFFLNLRDRYWAGRPARGVDHPARVPPGHLACGRPRGLRRERVPRRGRAGVGAGDPRQQGVVLAQRAALSLFAGPGRGRCWRGSDLTNRDGDEWLEDEQGTEARFTC